MNRTIGSVLDKLEKNGYEAYIIGGYVRDFLVGKESYDVDICTNATPKVLKEIFKNCSSKNLGGVDFKKKEYHFEITTYREEIKYESRKPIKYNYIDNLLIDLKRRDFTINTICMNKKGEIIDLLNASEDLWNKKIKMIGDINKKIEEDPLRILRGKRIATILDFTIEDNLYNAFKQNNKLILTLSNTRIKEELDRILLSENVRKGLKLLEDLGISEYLGITNYENIVPIKSLEGMYAQISISYELPYTKVEKNNIEAIKNLLQVEEITPQVLYENGLYLCLIVSQIKHYDIKKINKMYKSLKIHDKSEIDIKAEELIKELKVEGREISILLKKIEDAIIENRIKNKRNEILKYIKKENNMIEKR